MELFQKLNFLGDADLQQEIVEKGELVSLNKGDVVVKCGQYVKFLPIVMQGAIRVYQQKEEREILLYYVRPQETCTMSMAAAYFNNKSTSYGVATEPTEAFVFPASFVIEWQLKYASWNRYVISMFRSRYDELIASLENIAFDPVQSRVISYFEKRKKEGRHLIELSHERLAREVGTTRVVISRILKQMEKQGRLKLSRGAIEVF